jgi:hypothetical protein
MDKLYVLIAGTGVTSRANLEALVEDYFYAKGKEAVLLLAFDKTPSQGQIFAAQYAKDKGKDIVIFCQEGANVTSFSSASFTNSDTPVVSALSSFTDATVMLLWDDTDPNCLKALEFCNTNAIKAYNLCEGLTLIPNKVCEVLEPAVVEKAVGPVGHMPEPSIMLTAPSGLSEAIKAEITQSVLVAVEAALKNALNKA